MVSGHQDDAPADHRLAHRLQQRAGRRQRFVHRAVAQLQQVAGHDQLVGDVHGSQQGRPRAIGAQDVDSRARAQVQVGDDEGAHAACRGPPTDRSYAGARAEPGRAVILWAADGGHPHTRSAGPDRERDTG